MNTFPPSSPFAAALPPFRLARHVLRFVLRFFSTTRSSLTAAFLAFALTALPAHVQAQSQASGTITGRVLNEATGEYLRNAVIRVQGSTLSTTSEPGGGYTLSGVSAGTVQMEVQYTGLDTQSVAVEVTPGQTLTHDFNLTSGVYGDSPIKLGAFVVSSAREGNAKAIMEQRTAENMKKVITSDALGKVPENNVGEFLKLMPGVSMDYVETDVRALRIRGYNPKYSTVLVDGARVAMAGSSTIGTGRTFEFEQLSISSLETIELTKTPTPDQPSSAAGIANLKSKSAFDHKGQRFNYSLSLTGNSEYMNFDKSYGWDTQDHYKILPNVSFEFSDVLLDGKLGIFAGYSRSDVFSTQKAIWITAYNYDNDPTNNAKETPRANNYQFQDGLRPTTRANYNLRLDYKFSSELKAWAKIDFNTFQSLAINRNFQMNAPANSATAGVVNSPDPDGAGPLLAGPVVPGIEYSNQSQTIYGGNWQMTGAGTARAKFGDTMILTTQGEYRKDALAVDGQFQFSRADNWYESLRRGWFDNFVAQTGAINWSWTKRSPDEPNGVIFNQLTGADARNPSSYSFNNNSITEVRRRSKDQIWNGRLDGRYKLNLAAIPTTLKFGLNSSLNTRDVERNDGLQYTLVGPDGIANSGDGDRPSDFVESRFHSDWGFGGNANGLPTVDRYALAALVKSNPSYFTPNLVQHLQAKLQNQWNFKEQIDSVYFQSILKWGKFELAPGVRVERTRSFGRGPNDIGDAAAKRLLNPANPSSVPTNTVDYVAARYGSRSTSGEKYNTTLGYLHSTYTIRENLLLRASYHDAITRADISNLIPGISGVDEVTQTLTATNPDLRAEKSQNINVSLEYYFEPVGQLTIGYFNSKIKDLQRTLTNIPVADTFLAATYPGYTLSTTDNVASSKTNGFEIDYAQQLTFLPGVFKRLGVFANYTRVNFDDWVNYLGSPKNTWNAGINYTLRGFYVQFKTNYTGKKQTSSAANGWNNYDGQRVMCDINVSYSINRQLTLFLNGRNIFDEPLWGYTSNKEVWGRYARFGSLWEVGVKGSL